MSNRFTNLPEPGSPMAEPELQSVGLIGKEPPGSVRNGRFVSLLAALAKNHHVLSLADQGIVSATNFATTILLGRMAWKAELGNYWLGMTLVLLILSALNSLISSPLTLFIQRKDGLSPEVRSGVSLIHVSLLALLASFGFLLAGLAMVGAEETHAVSLVLFALALLAPPIMLREFARRVSLAKLQMTTVLTIDVGVSLVQITGLLWLGMDGKLNSVTAFVASGTACGTAVVAWLWVMRSQFAFDRSLVWPEWSRNWTFGRWILIDQLTVTANMYSLYWLLAFLKDTVATGNYSACMAIVSLANPFVFGMTNVLAPRLARAHGEADAASVRRLVWTSSAIIGLVVGGYSLLLTVWGDAVLELCYGAQFTGQHWTIITCVLAMFAGVMGTSVSHGLWVKQRNDINFRASSIGLVVTLLIAVPLLDDWGAVAANLGLLGGNIVATCLRYWAFVRLDRHRSAQPGGDSGFSPTNRKLSRASETAGVPQGATCVTETSFGPTPRVSIGLPVYNGANYLPVALDCLLAQSFTDFEIIISDNASTDETPAICRHYVAQDSRVRYHRVEENRGLTWNFNRVVELARGAYFTWAAHDDLRAESFLRQCVEVLDRNAEVVVCHSHNACIDATGQIIPNDRLAASVGSAFQALTPADETRRTAKLLSRRAPRRLAGVLMYTTCCYEIYGLMRTSALRQTGLMRPFFGSDMVLLAELSLNGRIHILPETLFYYRSHEQQASLASGEPEARQTMPVAKVKPRRKFAVPRKVRYPLSLLGLLVTTRLRLRERLQCVAVLLKFGVQPKKWHGLLEDILDGIKSKKFTDSADSSSANVIRAS
jgi:O-antigen/teichoic acid export membrane protein/GT2 family glycosyltransferase